MEKDGVFASKVTGNSGTAGFESDSVGGSI